MIKNSKKHIDFFSDPSTTLHMLECIQFYRKIIKSLDELDDDAAKDLIADLKDNIANLRKVYHMHVSNIIVEKVNSNLNEDSLKSHKLFSKTIDSLFNELL